MKIAVTSTAPDFDAPMDPRFGRAACFLVVDTETMAWSVVENSQNLNAAQGAGIQAGKTIVETGCTAIITGNCGPKAFRVLTGAGIKIVTGAKGSARQAVEQFKAGELQESSEANVEGHWI
ncbi:NifB/NifX family molybdenum-iron cluster-binding protein [Desulfoluna spongiiphila]|uniref:Predicted Fe-Mo cluster-binding protein, NifX family n=1 Tax=Desulfoluna spongiiphila TaxID=419481 RepID=A0A1G5BWI3_9BACT|nr:NifB/NifX family molybdenum-iron cluster-binding protein [Desulfoluna spongiiphila]SCX94521.1 Predicted Fe-Mo cluster-binding protein, NifX family [Desulfoluna spongiiphila]VVS93955.1 dinitrogenase iron-molybdenum cofactor biosynthesis [Desulfoluna spongiiphila]